jgi:hypothetical protein
MKYVLRYNQQELDLPVGEFLIGRAATCQLSLDDPLVSRNHAALMVSEEGVVVEDLGSRNGVKVNGQRITGSRKLMNGDVITIGSQELRYAVRRDIGSDTLVQAATQRVPTFGLMGILADKALALGKGEEAERLIAPILQQYLGDLEGGRKGEPETLQRACDYALRIATITGSGDWVDYIFRAYATTKKPCPAELVDQLYDVLRKVKSPTLTALRAYLAVLRSEAIDLGPAERFLVGRLEGLERVAAAR